MIAARIVLTLATALALVALSASTALADLAPPDDYVEECTLEKQQVDGLTCVACDNGYDNSGDCENLYGGEYTTSNCQSWGGSFWTEVWCKGEATAPAEDTSTEPNEETSPTTPTDDKDESSGCSVSTSVAGGSGGGLMASGLFAALLGFVAVARRRRA